MMQTRDILLERRAALLMRHVAELARANEHEPSVDLVDTASDQWDERLLSLLSETDAAAVVAIDAALDRLERGLYGTCAVCGGAIESDRLRALPEAVACAECAEFAESRVPRFTHRA